MSKNKDDKSHQSSEFWLDCEDRRNYTHAWRFPSRRERRRQQVMLDWFGLDRGKVEIMARRSPAVSMQNSLDALMCELGQSREVWLEKVRDNWPELVGSEIARRTEPVALKQDCLEIEVNHSTWLYELRTRLSEKLTRRLNEFTEGRVNNLRFLPGGRRRKK